MDFDCTEKHSPIYKKHDEGAIREGQGTDESAQTTEPLYTPISIALMRKLLQEFKVKGHSELVELPDWLKSESENERNRHRFFSSLCKPKLIHKKDPF